MGFLTLFRHDANCLATVLRSRLDELGRARPGGPKTAFMNSQPLASHHWHMVCSGFRA